GTRVPLEERAPRRHRESRAPRPLEKRSARREQPGLVPARTQALEQQQHLGLAAAPLPSGVEVNDVHAAAPARPPRVPPDASRLTPQPPAPPRAPAQRSCATGPLASPP